MEGLAGIGLQGRPEPDRSPGSFWKAHGRPSAGLGGGVAVVVLVTGAEVTDILGSTGICVFLSVRLSIGGDVSLHPGSVSQPLHWGPLCKRFFGGRVAASR